MMDDGWMGFLVGIGEVYGGWVWLGQWVGGGVATRGGKRRGRRRREGDFVDEMGWDVM